MRSLIKVLRRTGKSKNVSFVVPVYNAEDTVTESLDSIFNGNFNKGDELLIVDDCSTDSSYEVLQDYKDQNLQADITILKHVVNKGDGAARNTAIEHARNELIFCLDSDNLLAPGSIRPLIKKILSEKADVAAFEELHYFRTDPGKIEMKWTFPAVKYDLAYHLSHHKLPSESGNYMLTKTAWAKYGRYPEYAGALNNWGFGLAQAAGGAKTVVLKDTFYYHRYGHESLWMRDEHAGKVPLIALQLLIPYLDRIEEKAVDYVFSKQGRRKWFGELDDRPLKLKKK